MSRYIDPQGKVFAYMDRLVAWQRGERPAPVTVEWDLSNRCVLGCEACHFAHTHVRGPWATTERVMPVGYASTGDLADLAVVFRELPRMARMGVQSIVWSGGGEPTTHPRWLDALQEAARWGLAQGMYTAGVLGTAQAAALADLVTWVVVSLDADTAEGYAAEKRTDHFRQVLDAVRAMIGRRATVGVSFLLHEGNWKQAHRMLALGQVLGVNYTTFRPAIQHVHPERPSALARRPHWITQALPVLQLLAREPRVELSVARFVQYRDWVRHPYPACYGIRLNTTVTPDGRVWVCPNRRGIEGSCLGDLREEAFPALWAGHSGAWTQFQGCRVMCRLHPTNLALAEIYADRPHSQFI